MDFFQKIAALNLIGNLNIVVSADVTGNQTVSVALNSPDGKTKLAPVLLRGTAAEVDEGFFEKITAPITTAHGLHVDTAAHTASIEAAKKATASAPKASTGSTASSTPAKAVTAPVVKADPQKVAYDTAIAAVVELVKENKYMAALGKLKLPHIKDYTAKKDLTTKQTKWLTEKAMGGLFGDDNPFPVDAAAADRPEAAAPAPAIPEAATTPVSLADVEDEQEDDVEPQDEQNNEEEYDYQNN